MIETAETQTPVGTLRVSVRNGKVTELHFLDEAPRSGSRVSGEAARVLERLEAYFSGDVRALEDLPVAPEGTPFQRAVWEAIARIPAGETISYAKLASEAGAPRAVRAAGTACGANPVALIVPCHRVVRAGGALGNYGGGVDRKRWLLEHERQHTAR